MHVCMYVCMYACVYACIGNAMRKITELILEQVEVADNILLNKVDLIGELHHIYSYMFVYLYV